MDLIIQKASEDLHLTIGDFWTIVGPATVAVIIAGIILAYFLDHWRHMGKRMDSVVGYEEWRIQEMAKRLQELEHNIDSVEKKEEFIETRNRHKSAVHDRKQREDPASVPAFSLDLSRSRWASTTLKRQVQKLGVKSKGDEENGTSNQPPVVGTGNLVQCEVVREPDGFMWVETSQYWHPAHDSFLRQIPNAAEPASFVVGLQPPQ